jgi:6-phosphogluconolactonase
MKPDPSTSPGLWTRREFVRGAAGVVALTGSKPAHAQHFAYVACGRENALQVFSVRGDRWTQTQRVASRSPACVVLSKTRQTLYVANDVEEHEGLARGTVEVFHVDALDGRVTRSGIVPLSFSATRPRHMVLSPDGRALAVAAYGGGVYNVLPVAEDGSLGSPNRIFKEVGGGAHPQLQSSAHPHTLIFDRVGRLVSSDFGNDRLNCFFVDQDKLVRKMQRSTGEGSGPGACVLHSSAATLYAWHELEPALMCYRYASGTVSDVIQRISFPAPGVGALGLHPSGRTLYLAECGQQQVHAWDVDLATGKLSGRHRVSQGKFRTTQIVVSLDGESVYILSDGSIEKFTADRTSGSLHGHTRVALLNGPQSIAFKAV